MYQSWASLVDRNALEGLPDKERKRQEVGRLYALGKLHYMSSQAIFELIATEAAYVRDLQLIVEVSRIAFKQIA
jgi:actin cytoskeleton-regulatory complex protein PAN1